MVTRSMMVVLLATTGCGVRTAVRRAAPCVPGEWSPPATMEAQGGLAHVEYPQILAMPAGLAFFGPRAFALTTTDTMATVIAGAPRGPGMLAGFIRRDDGRLHPVPLHPQADGFSGVRAVTDSRGRAHVFWGSGGDTTVNPSWPIQNVTYARFDGVRWTAPQPVLENARLEWGVQFTAIAAVGDHVHLVMPTDEAGVHVHVHPNGTITTSRMPWFSYASLASVGDTLFLATLYAGHDQDRTRIAVTRSTDHGATWSAPVVIARSGRTGQFAVALVTLPGEIYALWESAPPVAPPGTLVMRWDRPDSVKAAVSRDGGQTWATLPTLWVPPTLGGLQAASGPDGGVYATFQLRPRTDSVTPTAVAVLKNHRWSDPVILGSGMSWPMIALARDSLWIAWDDWHPTLPYRLFFTRVSSLGCRDATPAR